MRWLLTADQGPCCSFVLINLPPLQSIPGNSRATLGSNAQRVQVRYNCCLTQLA